MANAHIHATSSAKMFGGTMSDYLAIHELMDSSKLAIPSNYHRYLTHNNWFVCNILPRIFGDIIVNSDGKNISVREIGIRHILEDFRMRFVPTVQDYLEGLPMPDWVNNSMGGALPPSAKGLYKRKDDLEPKTRQELGVID